MGKPLVLWTTRRVPNGGDGDYVAGRMVVYRRVTEDMFNTMLERSKEHAKPVGDVGRGLGA